VVIWEERENRVTRSDDGNSSRECGERKKECKATEGRDMNAMTNNTAGDELSGGENKCKKVVYKLRRLQGW